MLYRPDVCGFDFSASTSIDKTQTRYRAAFTVGTQDVLSEILVTNNAVGQLIDSLSSRQMLKWCPCFVEATGWDVLIDTREKRVVLPKATLNYLGEVFWG